MEKISAVSQNYSNYDHTKGSFHKKYEVQSSNETVT